MSAENRLQIIQGDICQLDVDAIVNAANSSLLGGGGVDGAIHRAAGPELVNECRDLHGCKTGNAKITAGYNLPARHVIHTVGPVWDGGVYDEDALLLSCYRRSCELMREHQLSSIAFPCVSTGIYGFPIERACRIALGELLAQLSAHASIERIICCCFSRYDHEIYDRTLEELRDNNAAE